MANPQLRTQYYKKCKEIGRQKHERKSGNSTYLSTLNVEDWGERMDKKTRPLRGPTSDRKPTD